MLMRSPAFGDPTAHPDRLQRIVRPGRPAGEVWGEQDARLAGAGVASDVSLPLDGEPAPSTPIVLIYSAFPAPLQVTLPIPCRRSQPARTWPRKHMNEPAFSR